MGLKEFLDKYGFMYDDFGAIIAWAEYNNNEPQLIDLISKLATQLVQKKQNFENKVMEWSYYAYGQLTPEPTEDLDFTRAINMVRLAYLSYSGSQFVKIIDEILTSKNIKMEDIKSMHQEIYNKYMKEKGEN